MSKKDGVDIRDLLQTIARRGGLKTSDPVLGRFETIRKTAQWIGGLYEQQVVTMKRGTMLITGSNEVTLGIDLESKLVKYIYKAGRESRDPATIQTMMAEMVKQVAGPEWTAVCGNIQLNADSGTTDKGRNPPKRPRARSTRKGRKQRK